MQRMFFSAVFGLVMMIVGHGMAKAEIDSLIKEQEQIIEKGISSQTLNKGEAETLKENLQSIRKRQERLKSEGGLNEDEEESLSEMLDQNKMMILDKKRNPVRTIDPHNIEGRISNQQRRISKGLAIKSLTKAESEKVQRELERIKAKHSKMKADGRLTEQEKEKLVNELNANSKRIYRKKHN